MRDFGSGRPHKDKETSDRALSEQSSIPACHSRVLWRVAGTLHDPAAQPQEIGGGAQRMTLRRAEGLPAASCRFATGMCDVPATHMLSVCGPDRFTFVCSEKAGTSQHYVLWAQGSTSLMFSGAAQSPVRAFQLVPAVQNGVQTQWSRRCRTLFSLQARKACCRWIW